MFVSLQSLEDQNKNIQERIVKRKKSISVLFLVRSKQFLILGSKRKKKKIMNVYKAIFKFGFGLFTDIFCFSSVSFVTLLLMLFRKKTKIEDNNNIDNKNLCLKSQDATEELKPVLTLYKRTTNKAISVVKMPLTLYRNTTNKAVSIAKSPLRLLQRTSSKAVSVVKMPLMLFRKTSNMAVSFATLPLALLQRKTNKIMVSCFF